MATGVKRTKNSKLFKRIQTLNDSSVAVGWFEDTETYPDGLPVAQVAYDNEFGNSKKGVPSRPFFRRAIAINEGSWIDFCTKSLKEKKPLSEVMERVGTQIVNDVLESVNFFTMKRDNSPRTVARKGFNAPLIDTSHMIKTLRHKVGAKVK